MGVKGDWPRRRSISREEHNMRWKLYTKRITFKDFEKWYRKYKGRNNGISIRKEAGTG